MGIDGYCLIFSFNRLSYQSGHVWGQSLEVQPEFPDVTDEGWETSQTAGYIPKWTTLPIAEVACLELISYTEKTRNAAVIVNLNNGCHLNEIEI